MTNFEHQCQILKNSAKRGRIGLKVFRAQLPALAHMIERDIASPMLQCWGMCGNVDVSSQKLITDPKILNVIGRLTHVRIRIGNTFHAGLLHTYGYVLSERCVADSGKLACWTDAVVEAGLGRDDRLFFNECSSRSLFQSVTYFLARIIDVASTNLPISSATSNWRDWSIEFVAPELLDLDYQSLKVKVITEQVALGISEAFRMTTRLVIFNQSVSGFVALLLYSAWTVDSQVEKLLACFPVNQEEVDALFAEERFGVARAIRPRYCTWIPDFPHDAFGIRTEL